MLALLRQFLDEEQANLIFCMLLSIPISYLLKLIKQKYLFLALSMTVTLAFQTFLFPTQCYFLWIQQQIVYALVVFAPRKYVGHFILFESFLALAFVQIRRIYVAYGTNGVDITGIFMMQLFVWVGMGYNYQNGAQNEEHLTKDQKKRIIKNRPSYITYLGYVNFLPACLIGPVYEYRDFEDYLHRVGDYTHIPSPFLSMLKQAGIFLVSLVAYGLTAKFHIEDLLTSQFAAYGLAYKFLYIQIIMLNTMLKYISAWSLGMISMKASGFTYNPSQNKHKVEGVVEEYNFDKVKVTDFNKFFLNSSLKVKAEGWNVSVQVALKKYIYEQVYNPTKTFHSEKERKKTMNKAQFATLMTSAIWHGFYPAYFITFFQWSLCLQISGQFFKFRTKHRGFKKIWQKYKVLEAIENITWIYSISYFGAAVPLLVWSKFKVYLAETYYIPYIILYLAYFLIMEFRIFSKLIDKQDHHQKGEHSEHKHHHHSENKQHQEKIKST